MRLSSHHRPYRTPLINLPGHTDATLLQACALGGICLLHQVNPMYSMGTPVLLSVLCAATALGLNYLDRPLVVTNQTGCW